MLPFLLAVAMAAGLASSCPAPCRCKWKGGKQTAECQGAGLRLAPAGLDPSTQVLDLSGNDLRTLPERRFQAIHLLNLQKVFLANCSVSVVHPEAFAGLANLVELDLSRNSIAEVPTPSFAAFPSLMRLILSENPLRTVKSQAFRRLSFLTTLELANCDISLVQDEAFVGLTHLEWLKLDGNSLTTIKGSAILPDTLHGLDLHNNRWHCDCEALDLHFWLQNFNVPHAAEPECATPARLKSKTLRFLDKRDLACLPDTSPTSFYLEIGEGKNVSLLCKINAVPEAQVSWWFQNQLLRNDTAGAADGGAHVYYYVEDGAETKRSELFILNANSEDNGTFVCVAENNAGQSRSEYTIRVLLQEEQPPRVVPRERSLESAFTCAIVSCAIVVVALIACCSLCIKKRARKKKRKCEADEPKEQANVVVVDSCPERNPDLVNDAESVKQIKWYRLVADVHLEPQLFLDADGYPVDFGLPKLYPRTTPQLYEPAEVRYTLEGYPYCSESPDEGYVGEGTDI